MLWTVGVAAMLMFGVVCPGCKGCKGKPSTDKVADSAIEQWKKLRAVCEKATDKKQAAEFIKAKWCGKKSTKECGEQRMKLVEETVVTTRKLLQEASALSCKSKKKDVQSKLEKAGRLIRSRKRARVCLVKNKHCFRAVNETKVLTKEFEEFKRLKDDEKLAEKINSMPDGALQETVRAYLDLSTTEMKAFLEQTEIPWDQETKSEDHFREAEAFNGESKGQKRARPLHLVLE